MIWAAVKMILVLGGILVLLFFLVRLFKRWEGGNAISGPDGGIRVLSSKLIAPQKHISLVEIAGEILALGVTSQQITFLTKIDNQERVKRSLSPRDIGPQAPAWLKGLPLLWKREKGALLERENEK
jgi:flagellar biogenesis protein FliO